MNTAKMLKDLLERVESGEIVITDFDVSLETDEIEPEFGGGVAVHVLTGGQTIYITTKPARHLPEMGE